MDEVVFPLVTIINMFINILADATIITSLVRVFAKRTQPIFNNQMENIRAAKS